MTQLQDTDKMPWGKHKGLIMQEVPASYLCWLWNEGKSTEVETCPVAEYINRNMNSLTKEYPNGIWT